MTYSPFLHVLYDQREPVGSLGRGTHYSVLRATVWHDESLRPLKEAEMLDFAVIWDEDHDERVIEVVEELYFKGFLSPVRFIGERKGTLTVLLDADGVERMGRVKYHIYQTEVSRMGPGDDSWTVTVDTVEGQMHEIIAAGSRDVATYLRHIEVLHDLRRKPRSVHVSQSIAERKAEERAAMQYRIRESRVAESDEEIPF